MDIGNFLPNGSDEKKLELVSKYTVLEIAIPKVKSNDLFGTISQKLSSFYRITFEGQILSLLLCYASYSDESL